MAPRRTSQPTAAELEILQVVWQRGSASVREVFEALGDARDIGYTTVLKLMQIMREKDLLKCDASARSHRFTAAQKREDTQQEIVGSLIGKAFGGSAAQLVETVLAHAKNVKGELGAIYALFAPGNQPAAPVKKTPAPAKKPAGSAKAAVKPAKKALATRKKAPAAKQK